MPLADSNEELAPVVANLALDAQDVSLVGVGPLVEGPAQADARLDRGQGAVPGDLVGSHDRGGWLRPPMIPSPRGRLGARIHGTNLPQG